MIKHCNFLFNHYTILFNKLKKDNLNLQLMMKFLEELKNVEDGKYDQNEASVNVGKLLKEIYIDSALYEQSKRDKNMKDKVQFKKPISKNLTWKTYKNIQ